MTPEALPDLITPESLTRALRRSGVLGKGAVSAVEGENARSTILSRIVRLRLAYEGEAAGAPPSLIFKTGIAGTPHRRLERRAAGSGVLRRDCVRDAGRDWSRDASRRSGTRTRNHWRLLLGEPRPSHQIVDAWPLAAGARASASRSSEHWARFSAHWLNAPRLGFVDRALGRRRRGRTDSSSASRKKISAIRRPSRRPPAAGAAPRSLRRCWGTARLAS